VVAQLAVLALFAGVAVAAVVNFRAVSSPSAHVSRVAASRV
jgi:hypothetical protein